MLTFKEIQVGEHTFPMKWVAMTCVRDSAGIADAKAIEACFQGIFARHRNDFVLPTDTDHQYHAQQLKMKCESTL